MSQNMLVERLKFAKRELTALKTAHRRGLGLLKVYTYTYNISPDGSSAFMWLTINATFSISPYPFIQMYYKYDTFDDALYTGSLEFEYKNSGFQAEYRDSMYGALNLQIILYSTSPIETVTHSWSPK